MKKTSLLFLIWQIATISAMQKAPAFKVGELPAEVIERIMLNVPLDVQKDKAAALKEVVTNIKAFLLSTQATAGFLYDRISMGNIINQIAAKLDLNPIEVAISFKTIGANKWLEERFQKSDPIPARDTEKITKMLIDANNKTAVNFVEKASRENSPQANEALIENIIDKKATDYYRLIMPLLEKAKDKNITLKIIKKIAKNSLKQFYVPLLELGLSQGVPSFGVASEDELAWSELIKQAIQEKKSIEIILPAIAKLSNARGLGDMLEYVLKNNNREYYPVVSRLYSQISSKGGNSKRKLIPLIINANLTELFDQMKKDIEDPEVSNYYSDREWRKKMYDQLEANRAQLKK